MLSPLRVGRKVAPRLPDWDVAVDWSNPLTESLVLCAYVNAREMDSSAPINLVTMQRGTGVAAATTGQKILNKPNLLVSSYTTFLSASGGSGTVLPNLATYNGSSTWAHFPLDMSPSQVNTVAFWWIRTSSSDAVNLEYTNNWSTNQGWLFDPQSGGGSSAGKALWASHDTSNHFAWIDSQLTLNELHHHVMVLDRRASATPGFKWYVDGGNARFSNSGTAFSGTNWATNGGLNVGARASGTSTFASLGIAHLCIWNRGLSQSEISDYFQDTSQIYRPLPSRPLAPGAVILRSQWFLGMGNQ